MGGRARASLDHAAHLWLAATHNQDPRKDLNQFEYIFAGNSYTPDIMAILGGYSQNQTVMFPGAGFPFPPIGTPGNNHVDLHVNCAGRGSYQIYYTLYHAATGPRVLCRVFPA